MRKTVFRVQDNEGRGPFKPGFTVQWSDPDQWCFLPPFFEEFGTDLLQGMQARLNQDGGHLGCGCAEAKGLNAWFSPTEQARLEQLGYSVVAIQADRIIAESNNQVVFWRKNPLAEQVKTVSWPAI